MLNPDPSLKNSPAKSKKDEYNKKCLKKNTELYLQNKIRLNWK